MMMMMTTLLFLRLPTVWLTCPPRHCFYPTVSLVVVVVVVVTVMHWCNHNYHWDVSVSVYFIELYQFGIHLRPFTVLDGPQESNRIQEIPTFLRHGTNSFLVMLVTCALILGPHGKGSNVSIVIVVVKRIGIAVTMFVGIF